MNKFIILNDRPDRIEAKLFELPATPDELTEMRRQNEKALAEALGFTGSTLTSAISTSLKMRA